MTGDRAALLEAVEQCDPEALPALAGALVEALLGAVARLQRPAELIGVEDAATRAIAEPATVRRWARRRGCTWCRWVTAKHLLIDGGGFDRWLESNLGRKARAAVAKKARKRAALSARA